jgi:hypothetical protein
LLNVSLRVPAQRLGLVAVLAAGVGLTSGANKASAVEPLAEITSPAPIAPAEADHNKKALIASGAGAGLASMFDESAWNDDAIGAIDSDVFALALGAARCATRSGAVDSPSTLTIIDYSKASTKPRLWVLDLATRALLYEELVSHGQGSGGNFATKFSNTPESHQTSIGLFVTESTYVGRNGYSLRLNGLDRGFNDRARERAIVMHGAPYVNASIGKTLGRLGRSHGCPAVREGIARELIDRVKGGSLVFSYYPDREWLRSSRFLNCAE